MKTISSSTFSGHPRGGPRRDPWEDHFPHEIKVEGLFVRKKPCIEQVEGLAGDAIQLKTK